MLGGRPVVLFWRHTLDVSAAGVAKLPREERPADETDAARPAFEDVVDSFGVGEDVQSLQIECAGAEPPVGVQGMRTVIVPTWGHRFDPDEVESEPTSALRRRTMFKLEPESQLILVANGPPQPLHRERSPGVHEHRLLKTRHNEMAGDALARQHRVIAWLGLASDLASAVGRRIEKCLYLSLDQVAADSVWADTHDLGQMHMTAGVDTRSWTKSDSVYLKSFTLSRVTSGPPSH